MGGKSNQAQRTKNAARPSSSGRSAEFLLQGTPQYTFSGGTKSGDNNNVAKSTVEAPINEEFASIDPNIQVVLKKLTKKDSVTKAKALLELTQLVEESDIEVVKAVVPLWPRLFKGLYADISHRVRECCQQAQKAFVVKLSKQIAPILKQIFPEWVASQFDTYAPSASLAKASLATAFPSHKLKDVLAFCHEEMLDYIYRMLLVPMPMPADKSYTAEEYEGRSERLVFMALYSYSFYLNNTAPDFWKGRLEKHQSLLADAKFWSYAKHKTPQIKAAWLETIGSILDRAASLLDDYHAKIVSAVVNNLDENDAVIQSAAWSCLLRIQLMVPNWISHTNMEKAFLVKIRKVLSEPNQALNTHLLPFVSHMNQAVLGAHCNRFLMDFFESLKSAMMNTKSGNNPEMRNLVDTYFECLHYVMKQIQTNDDFITVENKEEFKRAFLVTFLVGPISWTVAENGKGLEHVSRNVGMILAYWKMNEGQYSDLWKVFWESTNDVLLDQDKIAIGIPLIQLLINLRNADVSSITTSPLKKKRVRFGGEPEEDEADESPIEKKNPLEVTEKRKQNNWDELFHLADQVCQRCLEGMIKNREPIKIRHLYKLLTQYRDDQLVDSIAKVLPSTEFVAKFLEWISDESIVNEEMIDIILGYGKGVDVQDTVFKLMRSDNYAVKNWTVDKLSQRPDTRLCDFPAIAVYMEHILLRLINGITENDNCTIIRTYFEKTLTQSPTPEQLTLIEMICAAIEKTTTDNANRPLNYLARYLLKNLDSNAETKSLLIRIFLATLRLGLNGKDAEAQRVCRDVVVQKRVDLNGNLLKLCMEMVRKGLEESFKGGLYDLQSVTQTCCSILMTGEQDVDKLREILTYATNEADLYLEQACLIQQYIADRIYIAQGENQLPNNRTFDHYSLLMTSMKIATLRGSFCLKALEDFNGDVELSSSPEMQLIINTTIELLYLEYCGKVLVDTKLEVEEVESAFRELSKIVKKLLENVDKVQLMNKVCENSSTIGGFWTQIWWTLSFHYNFHPYTNDKYRLKCDKPERKPDSIEMVLESPDLISKLNYLKQTENNVPPGSLPTSAGDSMELATNVVFTKLLLRNYFFGDSNTMEDKQIIRRSCGLLEKIIPLTKSKELNLMYNAKLEEIDDQKLALAAEVAELLGALLKNCPTEFTSVHWDFLRIALSSWILTISNVLPARHSRPSLNRFIVAVLALFKRLMNFFEKERKKSSTQLLTKVYEEWNSVFAREVNTVLLLILHNVLVSVQGDDKQKYLLKAILPCFEGINFVYLTLSKQVSKNVTQQEFLQDLFRQLSNPVATIRYSVLCIVYKIVPHLVAVDNDGLSTSDAGQSDEINYLNTVIWPLFHEDRFNIHESLVDFQFRVSDVDNVGKLDPDKSFAYLYLWNVILDMCSKSTSELRAFYAKWIRDRGLEGMLLRAVFRLLPIDVIRSFETKSLMIDSYFTEGIYYSDSEDDNEEEDAKVQLCDQYFNTELLVCHTYLNLVRVLPAVVRKCWTNLPHRSNLLIEKFHMYYASALLCQEELRALVEKREKMDNMSITVHQSTRDIIAVYTKEEARMELMITLPLNYPLSAAKVEGGKSIGTRIQSKEVLMQLNLFLSHQNGTIWNGLSLWKRNLDKKFEGVEECYVCYSVIHPDTYQLPKLTCKTCKKRFHSPCLYRWFSTSNKSTCPICRNIF